MQEQVSFEQIEHNKKLLENHTRRLNILTANKALMGYNTPPEIKLEIEDIESEVKQLKEMLTELEIAKTTKPATSTTLTSDTITNFERQLQTLGNKLDDIDQKIQKPGVGEQILAISSKYGWVLAMVGVVMLIIAGAIVVWDRNPNANVSQIDTPTAILTSTSTSTPTPILTPAPTSTPTPTSSPTPAILPSSSDALIYNFEGDVPPEWRIDSGNGNDGKSEVSILPSNEFYFDGQHSLAIDAQLVANTIPGRVQLVLENRDLQNKVIIFRTLIPEDAPENIWAGLFIKEVQEDNNTVWIESKVSKNLAPGEWTTLVWSTEDAVNWHPPAILGIQFLMSGNEADPLVYEGPIYVDLVELLTLPEAHVDSSSLDHTLKPLYFYNFESSTDVPENITLIGNTEPLEISSEVSPNGQNVLLLNTNLTPYTPTLERGYGGIKVDLSDTTPMVDALAVSVLIPEQYSTEDGNFEISFVAIDDKDGWVYSGGESVQIGKWTSYFWGTRYAFSSEHACKDDDRNGKCDNQSETFLWHSWRDTKIKGFYFRILRYGDSYEGAVYIDNIGVYQVNR